MAATANLRAFVTGASRGVGRGIAEALGEIGARVALTGRDPAALAETAASVTTLGGRAFVAAGLAREYGFADVDGKSPQALTKDEA